MWIFERARDYYTADPIAQKLAWEIGIALLFLIVAFIGFHLFRRAFGTPSYEATGKAPPAGPGKFRRYTVGGRLYHWGILGVMLLQLISGAAFYFPGDVFSLKGVIGVSWLLLHVVFAWIFIAFVLVHIGYAIFDTGLHNMLYHRGDGHDLMRRISYYLGGRRRLPKVGKFDAVQKTYHLLLILFALVMIVTGISLFLSSELFATLDADWLRWQRLLHDIFAFLFLAVIIAHVYLRLLGQHRAKLASMFTGNLPRETFEREHDWSRWQPDLPDTHSSAAPAAAASDSKK
jgi:formate dehydrogenase subunit gamma